MLKITNYFSSTVIVDDIEIPVGGYIIVDKIKNVLDCNNLRNKQMITVTYVNDIVEDIKEANENIKNNITTSSIEYSDNIIVEQDINNPTKKKKSKDNSEVENSKSTKGDMNNATD